jgi:hypothetical protein
MGCLMKNEMYSSLSHEYFVLQINGRVSSLHRRYEDAVKEGLSLKYQFPQDDIKVCEAPIEKINHDAVLH